MQLSKSIFNFTDTQDVRILGGYRATVDRNGDWTGVRVSALWSPLPLRMPSAVAELTLPAGPVQAPYAQIRENNWSLNTDFKSWLIKYDL